LTRYAIWLLKFAERDLILWPPNASSQLIDEAGDGGPTSLASLANYLSVGYDQFDPVDKILDALSFSRMPEAPVGSRDFDAETSIEDSIEAIVSIITTFRALKTAPGNSRKVKEYSARCYRSLVDYWGDLTQWILNLVRHASNLNNPSFLLIRCAMALEVIISDAQGNIYKEDLVAHSRTLDLVYLLLCQVDQCDGRSRYILN
jgi:hypothetical protein